MDNPYQRKGSKSNAHAGKMFEIAAQNFFKSEGLSLDRNVNVAVGIGSITKVTKNTNIHFVYFRAFRDFRG